MILLVDVGNTRVKWAVARDGGAAALDGAGAAEHGGDPAGVIATLDLPHAGAVWITHVLRFDDEAALGAALSARLGVAPRFARTRAECAGLRVAYAEPERLGVDRWLGMLALWTRLHQAFCVVNAGTALTFDAVGADGRHAGGLIAPGLVAAQKAIAGATRFTIRPQAEQYGAGLGTDTESCVRQGALHACAGLVERASHHRPGARVVTGGDAKVLLPHLGRAWDWQPHLVLEGLLAYSRLHEL